MKLRWLHSPFTWALVMQLTLGHAPLAMAQSTKAIAEAAYRRGQELMKAGKADEACPQFAESQRLDPAVGTLVALAACHEAQGKIATAWGEYTDASGLGGPAAQYAQKRATVLEAEITRVLFVLGDVPADTKASIDDIELGLAVLRGGALPIDPGKHVLRLTARGRLPAETSFEVTRGTKTMSVEATLPREAPATPLAAAVTTTSSSTTSTATDQAPAKSKVLPWVLVGVGAAGLAAGGVLGILTLSRDGERKEALDRRQFDEADRIRNDALGLQTAAFVTAGVGLVAAGVGLVMLLTSGPTSNASRAARQPPTVTWCASPSHVAGNLIWSF